MASLPRLPGESLDDWDSRMAADWAARQPPARTLAEMTEAEREASLAEIVEAERMAVIRRAQGPTVAPFEGKHLRDMTPAQRAQAARELNLGNQFPSFVQQGDVF